MYPSRPSISIQILFSLPSFRSPSLLPSPSISFLVFHFSLTLVSNFQTSFLTNYCPLFYTSPSYLSLHHFLWIPFLLFLWCNYSLFYPFKWLHLSLRFSFPSLPSICLEHLESRIKFPLQCIVGFSQHSFHPTDHHSIGRYWTNFLPVHKTIFYPMLF